MFYIPNISFSKSPSVSTHNLRFTCFLAEIKSSEQQIKNIIAYHLVRFLISSLLFIIFVIIIIDIA